MGDQPDVATTQEFTLNIGQGSLSFITPTAAEGTADPAVPAFPTVINFVNPADPQAFFSFPFLVAGGTGNNILTVYMPRELELSVFDANIINSIEVLENDTDETVQLALASFSLSPFRFWNHCGRLTIATPMSGAATRRNAPSRSSGPFPPPDGPPSRPGE